MLGFSEEECVVDALAAACLEWPRCDDAWDSVTFVICRDPKEGVALNDMGDLRYLIWSGAKSIGMPDIAIIYRITRVRVEILEATFSEPKYAFAGKA